MENAVKLYHGSNVLFNNISLSFSKDKRDFGRGFYTTTIREQAENWAKTLQFRYKGGVFVYEFELGDISDLSVKRFDGLSLNWLEFIKENRVKIGVQHNFDIVKGAVANDQTNRTIALYIDGIYDSETALKFLRFNKANDQLSFHTEKALSRLMLLGVQKWKH